MPMVQDYKQMYYSLLKDHEKLQEELKQTRKVLATYTGEEEVQVITEESQPVDTRTKEEWLLLCMTLFQGRSDVYAKMFYNAKTERKGYAPQCWNEWKKGICDKKKYKCHACPNQQFKHLTSDVIEAHIRGKDSIQRDVIGIYPILPDETCYFLAVDFDKDNWQTDVSAFRKTCNEKNISVYVERSRSGNGAHAWFFFSERVPIKLARKFGNLLLTETMKNHHQLKFTSYDRLFPNQDFMPQGGLGNLIALPLQGQARKNGNSMFIDEDFKPIHDQWNLFATVEKLSLIQIEEFSKEYQETDDFGKLISSKDETKSWKQQKLELSLSKTYFPEKVQITLSNKVFIHMQGMSSKSLNEIKRLTAFKNPEFYMKLKSRLPIHNTPRIIERSQMDGNYLSIPRGCLENLKSLLDGSNVSYEIEDERNSGTKIPVEFNGELREEQELAVKDLLKHETGVLAATTAFGKTVIAASLIAERKVNTLILVDTTALLNQWKIALENFLIFNEPIPEHPKGRGRKKEISHVGQLGANKNTLNGKVDIAIVKSLVRNTEVRDLVVNYGMVVVDECHHVSAVSNELVLENIKAKYVYGLTATPERRDGQHPIIFMQCGQIRHKVSALEQAKKREFKHYFVPRFTSLKKPSYIKEEDFAMHEAYATVMESEERNLRIVRDIIDAVEKGKNPIVLTNRTAHVELLTEMLKKHLLCEIFVLTGNGTSKQKREQIEQLYAVPDNVQCVVVATGKYVGEGLDYPRLDTLFLAMPVSWSGILHQYAGRLHRDYDGKKEVIIYDYVDIHIRMLEKMYHKRVKGYARLGYVAKTDYDESSDTAVLFDEHDFLMPLKKELNNARLNIVISSPIINKSRVIGMLSYLQGLGLSAENITIITKPVTDYKDIKTELIKELLEQLVVAGFNVITRSNIHQKFIVIDKQIVWYGSINLLGYGYLPETMVRFVNGEVASEIVETVNFDSKVEKII